MFLLAVTGSSSVRFAHRGVQLSRSLFMHLLRDVENGFIDGILDLRAKDISYLDIEILLRAVLGVRNLQLDLTLLEIGLHGGTTQCLSTVSAMKMVEVDLAIC